MRAIVELWLGQLWKLTVLWPAWLLTPQGRRTLFSRAVLWKVALALAFALAMVALLQTLPADLALIGAGDVIAYLDVAVIAWVAGAAVIVNTAVGWLRRRGRPPSSAAVRPQGRTAVRRRRPRRTRPPVNDDGDAAPGRPWAIAA